jgi:hypothetical protein
MPLQSTPELSFLNVWPQVTRVRVATSSITNGSPATLVAAVAGFKIRVISAVFCTNANDRSLEIQSGINNIGALEIRSGVAIVLPYSPVGWFETFEGQALLIEDIAVQATFIRGVIDYVLVPAIGISTEGSPPPGGPSPESPEPPRLLMLLPTMAATGTLTYLGSSAMSMLLPTMVASGTLVPQI